MKKIIVYPVILLIIMVILFVYKSTILHKQNSLNSNENIASIGSNNNIVNSNNKNYKVSKKLVNKYEKYKNMISFLKDKNKELSWKKLDLTKDNFVFCIKWPDGKITFTPVYNEKLKNGEYDLPQVKYDYMQLIDKAFQQNCIYWWVGTKWTSKVLFEEDIRNPLKDKIDAIFNRRLNVYKVLSDLEKVDNKKKPKEYLAFQAYLYDFMWEYDKANQLRNKFLSSDPKTNVEIKWAVKDASWNALKWVKLTLLNNSDKQVITNKKWEYILKFKYYPLSHIRVKASKAWYSDGFFSIYLDHYLQPSWDKKVQENIVLNKANDVVIMDFNNKDKIQKINWKKYYIIKDPRSIYYVPVGKLYYMDWRRFTWNKLKVYLYRFKKTSHTENLTSLDTFTPVYWYVWNLMITFGMPYMQFFTFDGKEVFVRKKEPMILVNQIYHMKALFTNHDKIYTAVTTWDMKYLVKVSKKWGYPITYDWLIKNNFLRWPTRWVLERKKWTWVSIPQKVLTTWGLIQNKFYEIEF